MKAKILSLLWIQMMAMATFLLGFLPMKEPLAGKAGPEDIPQDLQSQWLERKVGQVVLVVIDALRADFVLPETVFKGQRKRPKIESVHDLIERDVDQVWVNAFVAKANTPTVTMPRIKALMSGSIPGFIDVILNFGSKRLDGDHLLNQWTEKGLNLTFFGDDTWLKLFPGSFMRSDGTTSFFVSDFTEVDQNVTRHLESEVSKKDWDVSILHYLGLDHIGHVLGPDSSTVEPKLQEMDKVFQFLKKELLEKKQNWKQDLPPLIVILGDHGMADAGGHGGSSPAEVLTPMVFISPPELKLTSKANRMKQVDLVPSLAWLTGVPIPMNNLGQLVFKEPGKLAQEYNKHQIEKCVGEVHDDVDVLLERHEENMTKFDLPLMLLAIVLALTSTILAGLEMDFNIGLDDVLRLVHVFSMLASSFIEEEHQPIYFFAMTLFCYRAFYGGEQKETLRNLVSMVLLRFARSLNQTGDKWRHIQGFNSLIKTEENIQFFILSTTLSLLILAFWRRGKASICYVFIVILKLADIQSQRLTWPALGAYFTSAINIGIDLCNKDYSNLAPSFLPILVVTTSPQNLILFSIHVGLEAMNPGVFGASSGSALTMSYLLGWNLFFNLGNSNGLATIDVGAGYVGVSAFSPLIVGSLLTLNTFSGPILWTLLALPKVQLSSFWPFLFFRGLEIAVYLSLVTAMRQHLFVWTVFSPKLLYLSMAVLVINILHTIFVLPFLKGNKTS